MSSNHVSYGPTSQIWQMTALTLDPHPGRAGARAGASRKHFQSPSHDEHVARLCSRSGSRRNREDSGSGSSPFIIDILRAERCFETREAGEAQIFVPNSNTLIFSTASVPCRSPVSSTFRNPCVISALSGLKPSVSFKALTKEYGYLQTVKDYKDFHMALRFKCVADGNSGVFFHTRFKAGTADVSQGMQFEIDPTANHHTGGLYGDGRQWIAWPSPENEYVLRQQDWNEFLLKVEGNHYVARLNGVVVIDFTDPTPKSFDGTIALQLHAGGGGDMMFRDIYVRDLSVR